MVPFGNEFSHVLFKHVFIKNDNTGTDQTNLDPEFKYKGLGFNGVLGQTMYLVNKELIDILTLYDIKMNYSNNINDVKKCYYTHQSRILRVREYINDKIDNCFTTIIPYYIEYDFYYNMFNEIFKKVDGGNTLNDSFAYYEKGFDYIKENYKNYNINQLRDILYLYDITMDYFDSGTEYYCDFKHSNNVDKVIKLLENILDIDDVEDEDEIEVKDEEDNNISDQEIVLTPINKVADWGDPEIVWTPINKVVEWGDLEVEKVSSEAISEDIKDTDALIDNFLDDLENPKEFKNLLGLKVLVSESKTFASSLDKVLNDYYKIEAENNKSSSFELHLLKKDIIKSKEFINSIMAVCNKYKFNDKYQNFIQNILSKLDESENKEEIESHIMEVTL